MVAPVAVEAFVTKFDELFLKMCASSFNNFRYIAVRDIENFVSFCIVEGHNCGVAFNSFFECNPVWHLSGANNTFKRCILLIKAIQTQNNQERAFGHDFVFIDAVFDLFKSVQVF